jgi:GTP-sensing pleiotropic transcriptional regulator CodY
MVQTVLNLIFIVFKQGKIMETNQLMFNIQLNVDQINVILATMGKLPYESISPLMNSIQMQANLQMQEYQAQAEAQQAQQGTQQQDSNLIQ